MESPSHDQLVTRCQELEAFVQFWRAANDAKAQRMQQLERECQHLRQQVARLGRIARRGAENRQPQRLASGPRR